MKQEQKEASEEVKALVIARIDAQVSSNLRLSIGNHGSLSKEEMIHHVKKGDAIGQRIMQSHLMFLKAVASGKVTKALVSVG